MLHSNGQQWTATKLTICVYDSKTLDENLITPDLIVEILQQSKSFPERGYELGIQEGKQRGPIREKVLFSSELSYTAEGLAEMKKKLL